MTTKKPKPAGDLAKRGRKPGAPGLRIPGRMRGDFRFEVTHADGS